MTCNKCDNGKYDVGVNKIEVIVAIPPVEVYLKIKDERITNEIEIDSVEKQIKVNQFCFDSNDAKDLRRKQFFETYLVINSINYILHR